jgi:signal transduction histidine kinase
VVNSHLLLIDARAPQDVRFVLWQELNEIERRLSLYADMNPGLFRPRLALVKGAIYRAKGYVSEAFVNFELAWNQRSLCHVSALAAELAGRLALQQGLVLYAVGSLREAIATYSRWGAHAVVARLASWLARTYPAVHRLVIAAYPGSLVTLADAAVLRDAAGHGLHDTHEPLHPASAQSDAMLGTHREQPESRPGVRTASAASDVITQRMSDSVLRKGRERSSTTSSGSSTDDCSDPQHFMNVDGAAASVPAAPNPDDIVEPATLAPVCNVRPAEQGDRLLAVPAVQPGLDQQLSAASAARLGGRLAASISATVVPWGDCERPVSSSGSDQDNDAAPALLSSRLQTALARSAFPLPESQHTQVMLDAEIETTSSHLQIPPSKRDLRQMPQREPDESVAVMTTSSDAPSRNPSGLDWRFPDDVKPANVSMTPGQWGGTRLSALREDRELQQQLRGFRLGSVASMDTILGSIDPGEEAVASSVPMNVGGSSSDLYVGSSADSRVLSLSVPRLEMESLAKATTALMEHVHLDTLLPHLLDVAMESMGAERGLLLIRTDGRYLVRAEASLGSNGRMSVHSLCVEAETYENMCQSVLRYVQRTCTLVTDDCAGDVSQSLFSQDPYVQRVQLKSVCALPICHRGQQSVAAVLYFENRQCRGAFHASRLRFLSLLSSQISLALYNAYLFEELRVRSRELERTNAKLEEVARYRDALVQNTTHELLTPLHGINALASMLVSDGPESVPTERLRGDLAVIAQRGRYLLSLVEDILSFSSFQRGDRLKSTLSRQWVSILDVVLSAQSMCSVPRSADVEEVVDVSKDLEPVWIDRGRIEHVLVALLSNARSFTQSGSIVIAARITEATAAEPQRCVRVSVSDSGCGIASDVVGRIWEPFMQLDSGTTRSHGGIGLGLTVSRQIVELHGGRITVVSKVGKGSCFEIILPLGDPDSSERKMGGCEHEARRQKVETSTTGSRKRARSGTVQSRGVSMLTTGPTLPPGKSSGGGARAVAGEESATRMGVRRAAHAGCEEAAVLPVAAAAASETPQTASGLGSPGMKLSTSRLRSVLARRRLGDTVVREPAAQTDREAEERTSAADPLSLPATLALQIAASVAEQAQQSHQSPVTASSAAGAVEQTSLLVHSGPAAGMSSTGMGAKDESSVGASSSKPSTGVVRRLIQEDALAQFLRRVYGHGEGGGDVERPRVLVVDDDRVNLRVATLMLQKGGFEDIVCVESGMRALYEVFESGTRFDCIVLDVMMPGMDGYEVARRVRERLDMVEMPIVFVSAKRDAESVVEGSLAGGNRWLTKPFDVVEFLSAVRGLVAVSMQQRGRSTTMAVKD